MCLCVCARGPACHMHNEYVGRRSVTILLTITHADRVMQGTLNTDPQITRTKIYPLPEKQMFLNLTLQPSSTTHPPSLPVRASHPPACQHGRERDRHPVLPAKWVTLVFQALKRWVSGKRAKSGSGWGSSVTDLCASGRAVGLVPVLVKLAP